MSKKTSKTEERESGSLVAAEDIWPEIAARDLVVGDRLECGPVVGVQKDFSRQPVRDVLLSDRPPHLGTEKLRQGSLAVASKLDRTPKCGNVRFIHEHALYTNRFVSVNEPVCVTNYKPACTVLQMRTPQRKTAAPVRSNKRQALPGPDGKTLGQRVSEAMAYESGRRRTSYVQKDLIQDVNRFVVVEGESELLFSQPMASAIMLGKVTRSSFTPYIAKACHVDAVWLARGTGTMVPKD